MNIFVLDETPVLAAQAHHDRHVVKMVLEAAQLMASALHAALPPNQPRPATLYRATHLNHPCAVWVRSSLQNYAWLQEFLAALNDEYRYRFERDHSAYLTARDWGQPDLPADGLTPFPQVMPATYQGPSTVEAYRRYYKAEKIVNAHWTRRGPPEWLAKAG